MSSVPHDLCHQMFKSLVRDLDLLDSCLQNKLSYYCNVGGKGFSLFPCEPMSPIFSKRLTSAIIRNHEHLARALRLYKPCMDEQSSTRVVP